MQTYHFTIAEDDEEIRIDRWLIGCIDSLSRSYIQKLIKDEQLSVNGKYVKASYVVHIGDSIDITVPDAMKPDIEPENIALSVLYEDNDVLVVDKPKGMVVHPAAGHASGTLVNALLYYCKDSLFPILRDNIDNGYIYVVDWGDFLKYTDVDIDIAISHKQKTPRYKIVKSV